MHKFYRPTGPYSPVFFSAGQRERQAAGGGVGGGGMADGGFVRSPASVGSRVAGSRREQPLGRRRRAGGKPGAGAAVCALIAAWLALGTAQAQSMLLPTAEILVGPQKVHVEVAATEAARTQGLMGRPSLPPNQGMLFVFEAPGSVCFWMKNTPLPLSIAFIDAAGKIINIADMQPHTLDSHCPAGPMLYALEMQQGWFRQHQIKAGALVKGLPRP